MFLSHNWGTAPAFANHAIVLGLHEQLVARGVKAWIDRDQLHGNVCDAMTKGIDSSRCVVVFLTKEYIDKVGKTTADNCKSEFLYAMKRRGVQSVLVVVLDSSCCDQSLWHGPVGFYLNHELYLDLSAHPADAHAGAAKIVTELHARGLVATPPAP